jgi:hypothetical protein
VVGVLAEQGQDLLLVGSQSHGVRGVFMGVWMACRADAEYTARPCLDLSALSPIDPKPIRILDVRRAQ